MKIPVSPLQIVFFEEMKSLVEFIIVLFEVRRIATQPKRDR